MSCRRCLAALVMCAWAVPAAAARDVAAPLIQDAGAELVQAHCSACHSLQLITSQRGDRAFWLESIRWMQQTQNLWPIPAEQETQILDYLAKNYAGSGWGRRPPLAEHLLPPAPAPAP